MSKFSMDLLLNQVQIKPIYEPEELENEGYTDESLEKGHIIGKDCEFGINDKEHVDIVNQLKKTDAFGEKPSDDMDVLEKLSEYKDQ